MAEYKARRTRKRGGPAKGEGAAPPHGGHMLLIIGLAPKKPKKKAGGTVEGKAARGHLGKRARGGKACRADGGATDQPAKQQDSGGGFMSGLRSIGDSLRPLKNVPEEMNKASQEAKRARGGRAKRAEGGETERDLGNGMMQHMGYKEPYGPTNAKAWMNDQNEQEQARRDEAFRMDYGGAGRNADAYKARARGGRTRDDDAETLDAREDANDEEEDGRDKVSEGRGTRERAVEMGDARASGGRLSAAERRRMPSSEFALPGHGEGPKGRGAGAYPIDTEARARNALARGAQHASPAGRATIKRRVHQRYPGIDIDGE